MDLYPTPSTIGSIAWRPEDIFADLRKFNRPSTAMSWSGSSGVGGTKVTSDGTSTPGSTAEAPLPSRFVRMPKVTPDGGALSYSKEHKKTVIVGRESKFSSFWDPSLFRRVLSKSHPTDSVFVTPALRLLGVTDASSNTEDTTDTSESINPSRRMAYTTGEGGSKVEVGINYWASSLGSTRQMTDVTWGPELFKNKIFTSSSKGEIIGWDLGDGGLKLGKFYRCLIKI
jgi:hypothetical protein